MKSPELFEVLRVVVKHLVPACAIAMVLGNAAAQTTTTTINLGTPGNGTAIPARSVLAPAKIPVGTLPPDSILRAVSIDVRLDTDGGPDTYANDLFVYFDSGAPPSGSEVLQLGGFDKLGNPTGWAQWLDGGTGEPGTACVDTKNSPADFVDTIDLNGVGVYIGSRGFIDAEWSGTITIEYDAFVPAAITSFGPGAVVGELSGNAATITWTVPYGTDVTALSPTFTLSSGTSDKVSGSTHDFTNPVVYTVTDGGTENVYTVTVVQATSLVWNVAGGGDWDTITPNWLPLPSGPATTFANGNEVTFGNAAGGTITIAPDMSPMSTTVNATSGTYTFNGSPIAAGSLVKSGGGTLVISGWHNYSGGTIIHNGTLRVDWPGDANPKTSLGSGPVTLNGGQLLLNRALIANALNVNGGTIFIDNGFSSTFSGPITINAAVLNITSQYNPDHAISGAISGPGGITMTSLYAGGLRLSGANTYAGATTLTAGSITYTSPDAVSGSSAIRISGTGKLNLNYSGNKNIAGLTLGGVEQPSGTHGSTASPATYKNDTYFSGTGTVTAPASSSKDIVSFDFGVLGAATVGENTVTLEVPVGTNRSSLAPTYTVSPGATGSPVSGTTLNYTSPQIYTITAEDLSTKQYTVTVTEAVMPEIFTWSSATTGNWSVPANWTNDLATGSGPLASGRPGYTLNFTTPGTYTATNNLSVTGFQLNQLNLAANVTLAGNPLVFVSKDATLPTINQNSGSGVSISNALSLGSNMTFGGTGNGQVDLSGLVSGSGSLTKNGSGTLRIYNVNNSFTGGTIINSGRLWGDIDAKVGTGPITLNGGILYMWRFKPTNALIVNGGSITSENGFNQNLLAGPVTLNATLPINAPFQLTFSNTISGVGGLTKTGNGTVILSNTCTSSYSGPTSVSAGTLRIDRPEAVSGNSTISISGTGKLNLNYSGTKTVPALTLGGVAQTTPGTYGSVASGASFQSDTWFTTGSLGTVTIGGGSDYGNWLAGFTFAPGANTTPTGDADGDGVTNFEEYAFGLNPTLASSVSPIVAQLDPATGNFQYTRRATPATTGIAYTVLTSSNLQGWASGNATETGVTTNGNIQTVTVNITAPPVDGRLFLRVQAVPAQ